MTLVAAYGWDTGILLNSAGTVAVDTSTKRTGTHSLRVNPATTGTGVDRLVPFLTTTGAAGTLNLSSLWCGFAFRAATLPAANNEEFIGVLDNVANSLTRLRITSAGVITVYDSSTTLVGTGSTALSTNTWYFIELYVKASATVGEVTVRINGTNELVLTNLNTGSVNANNIRLGKITNRNGQSVDFYYDDAYVDDAGFLGDGRCWPLLPIGDGALTTGWAGGTGATFAEVDEAGANDGDTSYWKSTASSDVRTVTFQSRATVGAGAGAIGGLLATYVVRDESVTSALRYRVRSGSTNSDSSSNSNVGATYELAGKFNATDPATSSAWTGSALDAVEAGPLSNAAVATRITQIMAHAWITGGVPAANSQTPRTMHMTRMRAA